jgi:hypothetical protein
MIKANYNKETGKVIAFNKDITPYIEITEEERKQPLPNKYSYYAVIDGQFTIASREPTEAEKQKDKQAAKQKRLTEIDSWLKANDWKVNKVYLGEWTQDDPRWLEYLEKRALLRAEHEILTNEEVAE